jgi:hypothetical protein
VRRVQDDDVATLVAMLRASLATEGDLDLGPSSPRAGGRTAEPTAPRERVPV